MSWLISISIKMEICQNFISTIEVCFCREKCKKFFFLFFFVRFSRFKIVSYIECQYFCFGGNYAAMVHTPFVCVTLTLKFQSMYSLFFSRSLLLPAYIFSKFFGKIRSLPHFITCSKKKTLAENNLNANTLCMPADCRDSIENFDTL